MVAYRGWARGITCEGCVRNRSDQADQADSSPPGKQFHHVIAGKRASSTCAAIQTYVMNRKSKSNANPSASSDRL
jgi:hypothetical protein